jgi:cytochrome P450
MVRDGLIPFMEKCWRELGDCYEFRAGAECIKVLVHPDDVQAMLLDRRHKYIKGAAYEQFRRFIGEGLISSEGPLWRRQRRIIQPSFYRDTVRKFGDEMVHKTEEMLGRWAPRAGGEPLDVHADLMRLTLEIIARTLFQLDLSRGDTEQITTADFLDAISVLAARVTAVVEAPRWLPTPGNRKLDRAAVVIDHVIDRIITERRNSGEDRDDMLGALLRARDDEGNPIDELQLHDEVLTMFLAGQETTAVTIGWTLWLLTQHPDIRARMIAEIDAAIGSSVPTVEDVGKLGYVKQVLYESMRMISPVWAGARNCVEADTIGDGYGVEVGERVMHVTWLTHKHPEFWPEPDRFDPDRFEPERFAKQHKFAFMPFNEGPRKCVGEHFATMESVLVLSRLFQRFDVVAAPGFVPEMDFQLTTRPRNGLLLQLRERG